MARKFMDIRDRGYLVTIVSSLPTLRKLDPKGSKAVDQTLGSLNAGNYRKVLLTKEFMGPVTKPLRAFRKVHVDMTVPYVKPWGILPIGLDTEYKKFRREAQDEFYQGVDTIYPELKDEIQKAKVRLSVMFDPNDFPTKENFKSLFQFSHDSRAIESAEDLRSHLSDEEIVAVENNIHRRYKEAVGSVYSRVEETVGRLADSLAKYEKDPATGKVTHGFHKTAVDDIRRLSELLPSLNITGDPKLDQLAKRIESELTRYETPELKENDIIRNNVMNSAEDILDVLDGYRG